MPRRLPQIVALTLAATLAFHVLHFYGTRYFASIHSDSAIAMMLAVRMLEGGTLLPRDWYYVNGDVFVFGAHVWSTLAIKLFGVGPGTLLGVTLFGFALEVAALAWTYGKLARDRHAALLATSVTLVAWSWMQIVFVYSDLGYGYYASLCVLTFGVAAVLVERARAWGLTAFAVFLLSISVFQNPSRGIVFVTAPLMAACLWPYRDGARRPRLLVAAGAFLLSILGVVVYRLVLVRIVSFSIPSGHGAYALRDAAGIASNVRTLVKGLAIMFGGTGHVATRLPGLGMILLAVGLVVREVLSSRAWSPLRFVSIAALVQLGLTTGPVVLGNLVVNEGSARYLMPSLLLVLGLAAILASRDMAASRWQAGAWLGLTTLAALLSILGVAPLRSLETSSGQWANRRAHADLAALLELHGLRHGFSTYWNANLLTLLSHGNAKTCPVHLAGSGLIPYRWNTDAGCFDEKRLPDRIFLVNLTEEREDADRAAAKSLPEPEERFTVRDTFDVRVYRTGPLPWLQLPLPEADALRFPLRLEATHPQIGRGAVTVAGSTLVSDGSDGNLVHGPYLALPKGRFLVRWIGQRHAPTGGLHIDVASDGGNTVHASTDVLMNAVEEGPYRDLSRLELDLARTTKDLEFRVYSAEGARVTIEALVIERR